jgi:hypothetical protein
MMMMMMMLSAGVAVTFHSCTRSLHCNSHTPSRNFPHTWGCCMALNLLADAMCVAAFHQLLLLNGLAPVGLSGSFLRLF